MADKAGKVTIVGAGTIGPTVAYALMLKELLVKSAEILTSYILEAESMF